MMTPADFGVAVRPFVSMGGGVHPPHTSFSTSWKVSIFLCDIPVLLPRQASGFPLHAVLCDILRLENGQWLFRGLKSLLRNDL